MLRKIRKAALDARTDANFTREKAKAAEAMTELVLEVDAADPLWSSSDGLRLNYGPNPDGLACLA